MYQNDQRQENLHKKIPNKLLNRTYFSGHIHFNRAMEYDVPRCAFVALSKH